MRFSFQNQNEIQLSNCEKAQRSHVILEKKTTLILNTLRVATFVSKIKIKLPIACC